jgi:hypothetical protein
MFMRRVSSARADEDDEVPVTHEDEVPVTHARSRMLRVLLKIPSIWLLPLYCMLIVALILPIMLPVYVVFQSANEAQETALVWPLGNSLSQAIGDEMLSVELDMVDIDPQTRVLTFLVEIRLGPFQHPDIHGMVLLPDDRKLVIVVGNQGILYSAGDVVTDVRLEFIMRGIKPLFEYPFDSYSWDGGVKASLVNQTDLTKVTETFVPLGVAMFAGAKGWDTHT